MPVAVFIAIIFFSCKKNPVVPPPDPGPVTPVSNATSEQLIADSIFLFSREIYYWQDKIGTVSYEQFNPRQYISTGDALATAKKLMVAVRNYNDYDKAKQYSYVEEYTDGSTASAAASREQGYGFGFEFGWKNRITPVQFYQNDPNFSGYYISYVYKNAEAGAKGLKRGMRIYSLNDKVLTFSQADYENLFNAVYNSTGSARFRFINTHEGISDTTDNITINNAVFVANSVLTSKVITTPQGRKAGYLAYKQFDKLADSKAEIDAALAEFRTNGVNDVILDLRYNGGGYTETQNYLANRLAPANTSGLMYQYYYNENLRANRYTLMKTRGNYDFSIARNFVNFSVPADAVRPARLYVIVGDGTASSSELLINNLKPKFSNNLVLIGNNTYGKPVGFFPIDLLKKVTFWTVSLMTKNSNSDSVSYNGFTPNYKIYDGVDRAFGDTSEDCMAAAITLIDGGTVAVRSAASATVPRSVSASQIITPKRKERLMDNMLFSGN